MNPPHVSLRRRIQLAVHVLLGRPLMFRTRTGPVRFLGPIDHLTLHGCVAEKNAEPIEPHTVGFVLEGEVMPSP